MLRSDVPSRTYENKESTKRKYLAIIVDIATLNILRALKDNN